MLSFRSSWPCVLCVLHHCFSYDLWVCREEMNFFDLVSNATVKAADVSSIVKNVSHDHDPRLCCCSQSKTCRPQRTNCSPTSSWASASKCAWGHVRHDERRVRGEWPLLDAPEKLRLFAPSPQSPWLWRTGTGESPVLISDALLKLVWLKRWLWRFKWSPKGLQRGSATTQMKPFILVKRSHDVSYDFVRVQLVNCWISQSSLKTEPDVCQRTPGKKTSIRNFHCLNSTCDIWFALFHIYNKLLEIEQQSHILQHSQKFNFYSGFSIKQFKHWQPGTTKTTKTVNSSTSQEVHVETNVNFIYRRHPGSCR